MPDAYASWETDLRALVGRDAGELPRDALKAVLDAHAELQRLAEAGRHDAIKALDELNAGRRALSAYGDVAVSED